LLRQRVDALRLLLVDLLDLPEAQRLDWDRYGVLLEPGDQEVSVDVKPLAFEPDSLPSEWQEWLDQMRRSLRSRRYALRTERAYADWLRRFARFCSEHDRAPDSGQARAFIEWLRKLPLKVDTS